MHEVTQCPVCDGQSDNELVSFPKDPYLKRLPTRKDYRVQYVVCTGCGFVYQRQMMDEAEMTMLYSSTYRPDRPDPGYLNANRVVALEVYSWITSRTGMQGRERSVLDIGCATGMFLRPFAQQGWRAVGLDAGGEWIEYGRRAFGLDLRSEFFTGESCPGRQFDLILFSHVIEHVFDPAPVLAAIREKLSDGGYLFIGTPNVLAPKRKLYPGLFGGDHVRLFSPRTLSAYLRRHGFRAVTIETCQPRGLRALAVKTDRVAAPDLRERDEWQAVHALYRGLFTPAKASILQRNLASLVERQEEVLAEACRWHGPHRYCVGRGKGGIDNVGVKKSDGLVVWLYGEQGSEERARRMVIDRNVRGQAFAVTLLVGLGLGHLAEILDAQLDPSCRLYIWEADPALFATVVRYRDLTALFRSPRVTLLVGPDVGLIRKIVRERVPVSMRKITDPIDAALRHPIYDEFDVWLKACSSPVEEPPIDRIASESACAAG